jgi:hypothetical protein
MTLLKSCNLVVLRGAVAELRCRHPCRLLQLSRLLRFASQEIVEAPELDRDDNVIRTIRVLQLDLCAAVAELQSRHPWLI